MQELLDKLANISRDDQYRMLKVIKEGPFGRTELVLSPDGATCIRKYSSEGSGESSNEYNLLSRLSHPQLPKIYDHYKLCGQDIIIEEYIQGEKLSESIESSGPLQLYRAIDITLKLCKVVDYLHRQTPPVIHRDIKPDNIVITPSGEIKLIDFGTARNFIPAKGRDTVYVGTLGYAPPEQFGFGQTDPRSDIYALGMTMLHMLTGRPPERGDPDYLFHHFLPQDLQQVIAKATAFDPDKRYQNVTQLTDALKALSCLRHNAARRFHALIRTQPQPVTKLFPVYCAMPNMLKIFLLPFHISLLLTFVVVTSRDLFTRTGFGRGDDILQFFCDFGIFLFFVIPGYILGFNLFNLNKRFKFFHQFRRLKKGLIIFALFVAGGILLTHLNELHSAAYLLAHPTNSAGS